MVESVIERHVLFVSGYIDLIELWSFQAGSVEILPYFFAKPFALDSARNNFRSVKP